MCIVVYIYILGVSPIFRHTAISFNCVSSFNVLTLGVSASGASPHQRHISHRIFRVPRPICPTETLSCSTSSLEKHCKMGLSENVGYIPNEIAIFHRDNLIRKTIGYNGVHNIFRHTQMKLNETMPFRTQFQLVPSKRSVHVARSCPLWAAHSIISYKCRPLEFTRSCRTATLEWYLGRPGCDILVQFPDLLAFACMCSILPCSFVRW